MVVGYSGSGKTKLSEIAVNMYDFIHIESSEIFTRIQKIDFYKNLSGGVARYICDNYKISNMDNVIISGLRCYEEVRVIKLVYPESKVIFIYAPSMLCYRRCNQRKRTEKKYNQFEDFYREQICTEMEMGLGKIVQKYADFFIYNFSSEDCCLKKQFLDIINESRKE